MSCTPKVSLCDATICVVASDFFVASLARRAMCGHTPLLFNLVRTGCDFAQKIPTVSIDTLLLLASTPGLNLRTRSFFRRHCPDCDEGVVVRLALPTVCIVSLTASVCQVFGNDCTEFDFGDHPVTVLSGPRTHRRGHIFIHKEFVLEIQPSWLHVLSHLNR